MAKKCAEKTCKKFFSFFRLLNVFSCMTDIFFCTEGGTQNTKKCPHPSPKQKQKERDRPQKCTSDWLQSSSNVQEDFEKKEMFLNFFLMESNELLLYPRKYRIKIFNWYFHFFPYYGSRLSDTVGAPGTGSNIKTESESVSFKVPSPHTCRFYIMLMSSHVHHIVAVFSASNRIEHSFKSDGSSE